MMKLKVLPMFLLSLSMISPIMALATEPEPIDGFKDAAQGIDDIKLPEGTRVVALGEATHGNVEFQELKLSVFQHLVKTTNVRGLILEGDFGGCALANEYIQGGEGTAEEVTKLLGYGIYRTDQMRDLVQWMHDYNETASEEDRVRLYGADIQNDQCAIQIIEDIYKTIDGETAEAFVAKFSELFGTEEDAYDPSEYDNIMEFLDEVASDLTNKQDSYVEKSDHTSIQTAGRAVKALKCYMEYREKKDFSNKYRDTKMAGNVAWTLKIEEKEHHGALMFAGHNGHISKGKSSNYTFSGTILKEALKDGYYAIGTDFYITHDNLPVNGKREVIDFCSDDPLAQQLSLLGTNLCYLNFADMDQNSELGKTINSNMPTGSLGEQYSAMYKLMKSAYQINIPPTKLYDSMILVYEATPIEIWQ